MIVDDNALVRGIDSFELLQSWTTLFLAISQSAGIDGWNIRDSVLSAESGFSEAIFGEITWLQLASARSFTLGRDRAQLIHSGRHHLDFGCPTNPSTPRPPTQQVALECVQWPWQISGFAHIIFEAISGASKMYVCKKNPLVYPPQFPIYRLFFHFPVQTSISNVAGRFPSHLRLPKGKTTLWLVYPPFCPIWSLIQHSAAPHGAGADGGSWEICRKHRNKVHESWDIEPTWINNASTQSRPWMLMEKLIRCRFSLRLPSHNSGKCRTSWFFRSQAGPCPSHFNILT